jgi:16S rRNA (cytidine1402-2'-O)-methyltransferase
MTSTTEQVATLFLVATPIGNLEDITLRAITVLREVDWVACEDTRRAKILLRQHQINTRLELYHDRNHLRKTQHLVELLSTGHSGALITDAGSPGISDPGYTLTHAALAAGITVIPIPGPSAAIAALTASGLPSDRFVFEGYLPRTPAKRRRRLEALQEEKRTIIFYISPHRYVRELTEMVQYLGHRRGCLAREMTKLHEEFRRGTISELAESAAKTDIRGEITLIVGGLE